jgi:hypothetical protein
MRRIFQAIIMLMLTLAPFGVSAQSSVTSSGFQVQNLNDSQPANIVITYYNADGSVNATQNQQILAGAALTFFNGAGGTVAMSATAGFRGSVVISSDQPIAAITNLIGSGVGESYGGFSAGSQNVSVPLITRNNFGVSTVLTIQNTGSASTSVTVNYTPGVAGTAGTDTATIPAGASVSFDQASNTALGTRFVGSAAVVAATGGSVVAIVNQQGNSQLLTYNAFTGGGTSIAVPLLVANNFGGLTGLQIQNTGSASADVTVTYSANSVSTASAGQTVCGTPPAKTVTIPANSSTTLIQAGGAAAEGFDAFFATCRYVGGATITSAQPLVAIVNQVAGGSASSYESFSTAAATATVKVPLAMANNFGAFTGIQVQNVGSASTTVTVTYGPNTVTGTGTCGTPTAATATVGANASFTFIQAGGAAADGFDAQFASCRYVGSATITGGTGSKVVAIVNQASSGSGDTLFTFNAFNQ